MQKLVLIGILTERRIETGCLQARGHGVGRVFVCGVRVIEGLEGGGVCEPESTETAEDDEGESVS